MKKLLRILGTITIMFSGMSGVIANSPYQKQELKKIYKAVVSDINRNIYAGGVLNNKLYFGSSDYNLYEYDPKTGKHKVVATVGGYVYPGEGLNNKLYFGSGDNKLYEYDSITGKHKAVVSDINYDIYGGGQH